MVLRLLEQYVKANRFLINLQTQCTNLRTCRRSTKGLAVKLLQRYCINAGGKGTLINLMDAKHY